MVLRNKGEIVGHEMAIDVCLESFLHQEKTLSPVGWDAAGAIRVSVNAAAVLKLCMVVT